MSLGVTTVCLCLCLCLVSPGVHAMELQTMKTLAFLLTRKLKDTAVNTFKTKRAEDAVRYFTDSLVTTMLIGCIRLIPDSIDIPPLDLSVNFGGPGKLTANFGSVKGLSTMKSQQIRSSYDDKGEMVISLPLTFTDLHVVYERFQFQCWPAQLNGKVDLKFKDNVVTVNVKVVRVSELIGKIANKECIFHVKSVEFSGFDNVQPAIKLRGMKGHEFLISHVFPVVIREMKKLLLNMVDVKVTNRLYNALPASSAWVCKDDALKQLILQTGGPITLTEAGAATWLEDNIPAQ